MVVGYHVVSLGCARAATVGGGRTVATVILILVRSRTPVAITTTRTGVVGSRGY